MAGYNWIEGVVDWMALPLLALLAGVLLYRRYQREFPLFFVYVIATDVIGITRLLASRGSMKLYHDVYWISDVVLAVFAFLVTYELFFRRLFPAFYKVRFFRYLFPCVALLITLSGALSALYGGRLAVLLMIVRVYEFLRATVLLFFVSLMVFMGRRWSKQEFGIALGFGLDVSAAFALLAILSRYGNESQIVNRLPAFAYDLACLVWLYCFWSAPKTPAPVSLELIPREGLHEARKWEEILKDFLTPGKK
jgi:hypothetical protein